MVADQGLSRRNSRDLQAKAGRGVLHVGSVEADSRSSFVTVAERFVAGLKVIVPRRLAEMNVTKKPTSPAAVLDASGASVLPLVAPLVAMVPKIEAP